MEKRQNVGTKSEVVPIFNGEPNLEEGSLV